MSFTINSGESVGLIGSNGSGKTSIEKLILGLYEPDEGSILMDGIDIKQIDPADLRNEISYVPQDTILFKGTLKENIIVRAPDAHDDEILKTSQISGAQTFVDIHPLGFDMPVQERGDGLSGGQKQSISIARAFIRQTPILLLDEPTNSMDSTSEAKFIEYLKEYQKNKTMLLVSHKNSLLQITQRLILLEQGKILIDGTYRDVLQKLKVNQRGITS